MVKLTADYLRGLDLEPDVVVDVGVWQGTPWLYEAWPDAHFVLVDPQGEAPLVHKPKSYEFHAVAAGVMERQCGGSGAGPSLRMGPGREFQQVLTREVIPPGSYVLKVDAEGDDEWVLMGAVRVLGRCLAVIVELPRCRLFSAFPNSGILQVLAQEQFSLYEWFDPDWPHDRYRNALFLPDDSRLFA